jgi:hypothetical protein
MANQVNEPEEFKCVEDLKYSVQLEVKIDDRIFGCREKAV